MDDWQKQAHIEGVLAEKETLGAILKQCQESNGKLKAEIDKLTEALIYCYNHTMTPTSVEMLRRGEDPYLILRLIANNKGE